MSGGKSPITTHVLDTTNGLPGAGIVVQCFRIPEKPENKEILIAEGTTDDDGRINQWLPKDEVVASQCYRLKFHISDYLLAQQRDVFFPYVDIVFKCDATREHYHVPLLLSAYSYSTYRGS